MNPSWVDSQQHFISRVAKAETIAWHFGGQCCMAAAAVGVVEVARLALSGTVGFCEPQYKGKRDMGPLEWVRHRVGCQPHHRLALCKEEIW